MPQLCPFRACSGIRQRSTCTPNFVQYSQSWLSLSQPSSPPLATCAAGSLTPDRLSRVRLSATAADRAANYKQDKRHMSFRMSATKDGQDSSTSGAVDPLVQARLSAAEYVILRSDLWQDMKWPLGSIAAQACHAAVAAIWQTKEHEHTQKYCSPAELDHMHKVVLEVKGEAKLRDLAAKLQAEGVPHKLWLEQPEDMPTCLALAPLPKSQAHPHVKRLKLCKGG